MPYVDLQVRAAARVSAAELERNGYSTVGVTIDWDGKEKLREVTSIAELPRECNAKAAKAAKKSKQWAPSVANGLVAIDRTGDPASIESKKQVTQLKRITLKIDDFNTAQGINTAANLKAFDLVAIEPGNARVFQYACEQADVDLITFDMANRLPFQLKKPWIDAAIRRGVFFELTYAPCLGDSAGRRYFFSNASNIVRVTKGRHIVLSSGVARDLFIRSPYDATNLGILVGLSFAQALEAVSTAGIAAIEHAARRRGLADVSVIATITEPESMEE